jgi:hypothetical protein
VRNAPAKPGEKIKASAESHQAAKSSGVETVQANARNDRPTPTHPKAPVQTAPASAPKAAMDQAATGSTAAHVGTTPQPAPAQSVQPAARPAGQGVNSSVQAAQSPAPQDGVWEKTPAGAGSSAAPVPGKSQIRPGGKPPVAK